MRRERCTYHLSGLKLSRLSPGAVIETCTLGNYGTTTENEQDETVTKVSDSWVWTDKGNRYSRKTGERWGDGDTPWPRCILSIRQFAPLEHPVRVSMERIGRRHDIQFTVNWDEKTDMGLLADQIAREASLYLRSSEFGVLVCENGHVYIDGGRFGIGTWERVTS